MLVPYPLVLPVSAKYEALQPLPGCRHVHVLALLCFAFESLSQTAFTALYACIATQCFHSAVPCTDTSDQPATLEQGRGVNTQCLFRCMICNIVGAGGCYALSHMHGTAQPWLRVPHTSNSRAFFSRWHSHGCCKHGMWLRSSRLAARPMCWQPGGGTQQGNTGRQLCFRL